MNKLLVTVALGLFVIGCGSPQKPEQAGTPPTEAQLRTTIDAMKGQAPSAVPAAATTEASSKASDEFISKGMEFLKGSDPVSAIKSFDQAIKINPRDPKGYLILAQTYMRLRQYPQAVDTLQAATQVAPDQGEIYYLLAVTRGLAGQRDLAKKDAEKSIELFQQKQDQTNFVRALALLQGLVDAEQQPAVTVSPAPVAPTTTK